MEACPAAAQSGLSREAQPQAEREEQLHGPSVRLMLESPPLQLPSMAGFLV